MKRKAKKRYRWALELLAEDGLWYASAYMRPRFTKNEKMAKESLRVARLDSQGCIRYRLRRVPA